MNKILKNSIKCLKCKDEIISEHRHNFVMCKCNSVGVDGGLDYCKRIGNQNDYEDLTIYDDNSHENRRKYLKWGSNYDKDMNRLPKTLYKCIKDLDTEHIQAILDGNWCKSEYYLEVFNEELKFRKGG